MPNYEIDEEFLEKQYDELMERAREIGAQSNYFFSTTMQRYRVQLNLLKRLNGEIDDSDVLIKKEYVKGRENLCINPAIKEYNSTAVSANNTVSTLIKIIDSLQTKDKKSGAGKDTLADKLSRVMSE